MAHQPWMNRKSISQPPRRAQKRKKRVNAYPLSQMRLLHRALENLLHTPDCYWLSIILPFERPLLRRIVAPVVSQSGEQTIREQ